MSKKKIPAIVLLAIDSIKKGVYPSKETLEAIWDEIDGNEATYKLATALLDAISDANASKIAVSSPAPVRRPVEAPVAPQRQAQVLNENTKPMTPAQLQGLKGRSSVISK